MKKDALEKFVAEHSDQWNDRTPSEKVWKNIASTLHGGSITSLWNSVNVWRAAAALLLCLSSFLFYSQQHSSSDHKPVVAQQEFNDIELFYSAQISEKSALVSNEGRFADDSFTQDLQKLEAMYSVLSDEMKKRPSEKVKDALVLNMIVRIDLLNQQIQRLDESKKQRDKAASL
jgi:hypothetical protein